MKNYLILFLVICYLPVFSMDSLIVDAKLHQLEVAPDTQKIRLYKELSRALRVKDVNKAKELALDGINLAASLNDSTNYYNLTSNLAVILAIHGEYNESIDYLNRVFRYFEKSNDEEKMVKALGILGAVENRLGNFQKADSLLLEVSLIYERLGDNENLIVVLMDRGANFRRWKKLEEAKRIYLRGIQISQKNEDARSSAKFLMGLGLVEVNQDNYLKGLEYYLQAVEGDYDDDLFKSKIFNNMGNLYDRLDKLDKALECHQKSLAIKRKLGLNREISNSLNNIGLTYKKQLNYGDALKCFEEALELRKNMQGTNTNIGGTIGNIGAVLMEMRKYDEAEVKTKQFLKISGEIGDQYDINTALSNLGLIYEKSGRFNKGIEYGLQSIRLAEEIDFARMAQISAESLAECYSAIGNHKKALEYREKYWVIRDSTAGAEVIREIANLEAKHANAKKESELKIEKEQINNLENKRKLDQLKIGMLALCAVFFAFISGLLVYFYRKEKKNFSEEKLEAEQKVEHIEQERDLLEQKISDQRLQLDNYIKQLLINSQRLLELNLGENSSAKEQNSVEITSGVNDLLSQNLESEDGQKKFEHLFTMVHKDFFKNLNKAYPKLSTYDLNLAALIKLNLNNKEIAQILAISPSSVKKARQRLYQKMDLTDNGALRNYIIQI